MEEIQYSDGQDVEVSSIEEGLKDVWFPAKVIATVTEEGRETRRAKKKKVLIEYRTLRASRRLLRPLREYTDDSLLRPQPPQEENTRVYQLHDVVDVYINNGWWKGVIAEVLNDSRYKVYFKNSDETTEFGMEKFRVHRDWVNGRWDPPVEERRQETSVRQQNCIELSTEMDKSPMPMKACTVKGKSIGSFKSVEKQLDLTGSFPENKRRKSNLKSPSVPEISPVPLMKKFDMCGTNHQEMVLSPEAQLSKLIDLSKNEVKLQKKQLLMPLPLLKKVPLDDIVIRRRGVGPIDKQEVNVLQRKRRSTEIDSSEDIEGSSTDIQSIQIEANIGRDVAMGSAELQKFPSVNNPSNNIDLLIDSAVHQKTGGDEDLEAAVEDFSFESTNTTANLLGQDLNISSSLLPLDESDVPRSLPFAKSSQLLPLWETVGSMSPFKSMPQQPHFCGLENVNENLREGIALGWMVSFVRLVEQTCTMSNDEPRRSLETKLLALVSFEELGFTVDPIRSRLEEMLKIKDQLEKLENDSKDAEMLILKEKDQGSKLEVQVQDMQMQINEIQKTIMEMSKTLQSVMTEKERTRSSVTELKKTVAEYRQSITATRLDFQRLVSAPW